MACTNWPVVAWPPRSFVLTFPAFSVLSTASPTILAWRLKFMLFSMLTDARRMAVCFVSFIYGYLVELLFSFMHF